MCCFNRQNQNYFCHCTPCCAPYFWQGELLANGYNQTNETTIANQTSGYNQDVNCNQSVGNWALGNAGNWQQNGNASFANANGLVPITCCVGNMPQCCQTRYTFANCCRGNRVFANNFALDRPVSASFVHTPNYHNIVTLGF